MGEGGNVINNMKEMKAANLNVAKERGARKRIIEKVKFEVVLSSNNGDEQLLKIVFVSNH